MLSYHVQLPVTHNTYTSSFEVTCNALTWPTWPFIINLTPVGIFVSLLARLEGMGWAPLGIVYVRWGWKGLKYPSRKLGNVYGWWRKAWAPFPQVHRDKYHQWCGYQKMVPVVQWHVAWYMIALLYMVMASKIFHNFHMHECQRASKLSLSHTCEWHISYAYGNSSSLCITRVCY